MNAAAKRPSLMRRLVRYTLVSAAVIVIVLAIGLGLFRLVLVQVPRYQDELKAFVAEQIGLDVEFASIDARLGLAGPALYLRDASIGSRERGVFLEADQAAITIDPFALVLGRRIEVSQLTVAGVVLTIERDADGRFRIGDRILTPQGSALDDIVLPSVAVVIRNSSLRYVDQALGRDWQFDNVEVGLDSDESALTARLALGQQPGLANRVQFDLKAELPRDDSDVLAWHVDVSAGTLDLAMLQRLLPIEVPVAVAGTSDLVARIDGVGDRLDAIGLDARLGNLALGPTRDAGADDGLASNDADSPGLTPAYDSLTLRADWRRLDDADWRLRIDNLDVVRNGVAWPGNAGGEFHLVHDGDVIQSVSLHGSFARLADLAPIVRAFPATQIAEQWDLFEPVGDLSDVDFSLDRRDTGFVYTLAMGFDELGVQQVGPTPGLEGVTGHVRAAESSGTIEFASGPVRVDWPALFPRIVRADSLSGAIVWHQGPEVLELLGVDLTVGILGRQALASLSMNLPRDGSSPTLDLKATLDAVDLVPAKDYLPTPIMPDAVADWLDRAVAGGRAHDIELGFYGPVASFPFDDGRGQFRVAATIENATLDYMHGWPLAESLNGRIEFLNAGFSASGAGRTLTNVSDAVTVEIPDMRRPLLTLTADTEGPLAGVVDYLRSAPLIAAHLGPDFERIAVDGGTGAISARIDLPLLDLAAYALDARLAMHDGEVRVAGFGPAISEINGVVTADEHAVAARDVEAVFLGGPVTGALAPSTQPGYRAELSVDGETSADAIAASFALPHEELLAGQTRWRGRLLMPALDPLATSPTRITLESNLSGIALRFPEPLAKPPGQASNLTLDLVFEADRRLEVSGNLGATQRFVLSFAPDADGLHFARGAVRFGGDEPSLPIQSGILVDGRLESLVLDDWLALSERANLGRAGPLFLGANLEVGDFHAYGQQLGETSLRAERADDAWDILVDSEAIAGEISIPRGADARAPIRADMSRVYLAAADGTGLGTVDPRVLPGIELTAAEFGVGPRRFGRVAASLTPDPRGLLLTKFTSATDSFAAELSGSWFQGSLGERTTLDVHVVSDDVATALDELGLDPTITGESAEVTANVYWDSAPGGDWLDHLNGDVSLFVDTGTLLEINPGAGRVVGLMSIAALPRRLALDFRDVFNEGFAFDEISGTFRIIDGNAYTNDLKFGGPAAEIGIVGRTGLRDRDYSQQFVVTTESGNVLPTVAGLLGGPGAGAALFVFTRLFKEPLKGIGRATYCLRGSWDEPVVEPINKDATEEARDCAELPEEMLVGSNND